MLLFATVVVILVALYLAHWVIKPLLQSFSQKPATNYQWQFEDPSLKQAGGTVTLEPFPSIYDPPSKYISLIAPAYNEEARIETFLQETLHYLMGKSAHDPTFTWELVIVDDGSKDRTKHVAMDYVKQYGADKLRVLSLDQNQGKGGAVQQGMLHARGELLLMLDSDGATRISDLDKLLEALQQVRKDGKAVVIGSRAHLEQQAGAKRKWYRGLISKVFNLMTAILAVRGVKDTQCGFKLFTRETASTIFYNQHLRRWSFDVELLHIAQRLATPIKEVSVHWTEVEGSKVNVVDASLQMARDLLAIRLAYSLGIWRVQDPLNRDNQHLHNL